MALEASTKTGRQEPKPIPKPNSLQAIAKFLLISPANSAPPVMLLIQRGKRIILPAICIGGIHPEVGDVILFQESYWEVDNTNIVQFFAGKDPDYPYPGNPLNPNLQEWGYNVSVTCECHYIPSDRLNIIKTRL